MSKEDDVLYQAFEDATVEYGTAFQEFLKVEPEQANLPYPENHHAFARWFKAKKGKETIQ